jgi:hypothetical protein
MDGYFRGAALQLVERGRVLSARIPRDLPRDYDTLAQVSRARINQQIDHLRHLLNEPLFSQQPYYPERLRLFKRIVAEMDILETVAIAALDRAKQDDHKLNQLLERIASEIHYPLVTPVVTTLSQQYFHIYPELNLLCVPLTEGQFLLHLPDLYHELGHPLLTEQNDPLIEPLQQQMVQAITEVIAYISQEQSKESRRRGPVQSRYLLKVWEVAWIKFWITELFCDIFAASVVGPAFAWAHLHLAAKRGGNPFDVPMNRSSSHPADDARMRVILCTLARMGFGVEASTIGIRWNSFLSYVALNPEPEYHRCFPEELLQQIVEHALKGIEATNLRIAKKETSDPVHKLLNEAWSNFWDDPDNFVEWEKHAVTRLFNSPGITTVNTVRS